MSIFEFEQALKFVDWSALQESPDGETFPVKLWGEYVTATKVHSEGYEDSDDETDLVVVVEVGGRFFRKEGWSMVGSHCYGDYEPSWNSGLTEVYPKEQDVTVWE